jgi:hypothetical protein
MTPSTNASNKYEMRRDDLNKLVVLSTDDSHTMLPSAKARDKFGVEKDSGEMSCCCE